MERLQLDLEFARIGQTVLTRGDMLLLLAGFLIRKIVLVQMKISMPNGLWPLAVLRPSGNLTAWGNRAGR